MNQTDSFFAAIKLSLFRYHQTHLTMWRSICNSVTCGMLWELRFHSPKLLPRCSVTTTHGNFLTGNYSLVVSEHLHCCSNVSLCRKLNRYQSSSMIIPNFLGMATYHCVSKWHQCMTEAKHSIEKQRVQQQQNIHHQGQCRTTHSFWRSFSHNYFVKFECTQNSHSGWTPGEDHNSMFAS